MSDIQPSTVTTDAQGNLVLPAGWQIGPGRETSQINAQNQVIQGLNFPLTAPDGTVTSVFIPYGDLHVTDAVQAVINKRTAAITRITGATTQ